MVLECDLGELMLLPITGTGRLLLVPFRLSMEAKTVQGELILGDRDPLPIRIDNGVAKKDAITAWTCALLGFADATCFEFDPAEPTARRRPKGPRRHSRSLPPRHRPPTQTLPRRQRWPSYLEPVGQWTRYSGSLVAAHRRRLANGRQPRMRPVTGAPGWMIPRPHGRGLRHIPAASPVVLKCASCGMRRPALRSSVPHIGVRLHPPPTNRRPCGSHFSSAQNHFLIDGKTAGQQDVAGKSPQW